MPRCRNSVSRHDVRVTHRAARLPLDKSAGGGPVDNPIPQGYTYHRRFAVQLIGARSLCIKDNQPKLAESITDFFATGQAARWQNTWHRFVETVEKDHGRLEVQRCWTFLQLEGLSEPQHRNRGMI